MVREGYDTAQVCPNGHVANSMAASYPDFNKKFCEKCGEATITACPHCSSAIQGQYHVPGALAISEYHPPAYCHNCGKPFPWTERKIQAALELASEDGGLSKEEAERFKESVSDIVRDTPRTQVGAVHFKKLLAKMGQQTTQAIRDIVVDIVSESAKKIIWPDK